VLDDVARVQRGEAPLGPDRPEAPRPKPEKRDKHDDALDAELDRLG
jgi:hypothetical protein